MSGYTKQEIIDTINSAVEDGDLIYQLKCINYKGNTSDTKEKYTEVIAEYLLNNIDILESNITQITRNSSYNIESHDGKITNEETSNRIEEITAKKMFGNTYPRIGKVLDYQIPLKNKQEDNAGKIDVLSYKEDENTLYLLELKVPKNKTGEETETLLRSVLEIYTYSKQVDQEKLLNDFDLPNAKIQLSVLHVKNNKAYNEFYYDNEALKVKELMKALSVKFNYIE